MEAKFVLITETRTDSGIEAAALLVCAVHRKKILANRFIDVAEEHALSLSTRKYTKHIVKCEICKESH